MKKPGDMVLVRVTDSTPVLVKVLLLQCISREYDEWLTCRISKSTNEAESALCETVNLELRSSAWYGPGRDVLHLAHLSVMHGEQMVGKIHQLSPDQLMRVRIRIANWIKDA